MEYVLQAFLDDLELAGNIHQLRDILAAQDPAAIGDASIHSFLDIRHRVRVWKETAKDFVSYILAAFRRYTDRSQIFSPLAPALSIGGEMRLPIGHGEIVPDELLEERDVFGLIGFRCYGSVPS